MIEVFLILLLFSPSFGQNPCDTNNGGCSQVCTDNGGTADCSCNSGYTLLGDQVTCVDVNECNTNNGGCDQICINSEGSYSCSCNAGYTLNADSRTCDDVDECATNNGGCAQTCVNTVGSYTCECSSGYSLNQDGKDCDDINECATGNGGCEQNCINSNGSYTCSCNNGYDLAPDGKGCQDVDECQIPGACDQICTNTIGSYTCSCNAGYRLNLNGRTCDDINECSTNNGGCKQICLNTIGSYSCSCNAGYILNGSFDCSDTNECLTNNGGCNQICQNTIGSYQCSCNSGYTLGPDMKTCNNINECLTNNGGCDQICIDSAGSYSCSCNSGYLLVNSTKCVDINECLTNNGGCSQFCNNTIGSYFCSCKTALGYTLGPDQKTCIIVGWTCNDTFYGQNDICDCGCGLVDPDCAVPENIPSGCQPYQTCERDTGRCIDTVSFNFDIVWVGPGNTGNAPSWDINQNWNPARKPNGGDNVRIPKGISSQVYIKTNNIEVLGLYAETELIINRYFLRLKNTNSTSGYISQLTIPNNSFTTSIEFNSTSEVAFDTISTPSFLIKGQIKTDIQTKGKFTYNSFETLKIQGNITFVISSPVYVKNLYINYGKIEISGGVLNVTNLYVLNGADLKLSSNLLVGSMTWDSPYAISSSTGNTITVDGLVNINTTDTLLNLQMDWKSNASVKWGKIRLGEYGIVNVLPTSTVTFTSPPTSAQTTGNSAWVVSGIVQTSYANGNSSNFGEFIIRPTGVVKATAMMRFTNLRVESSSSIWFDDLFFISSSSTPHISFMGTLNPGGMFNGNLDVSDSSQRYSLSTNSPYYDSLSATGRDVELFLTGDGASNITVGSLVMDGTIVVGFGNITILRNFIWKETLSASVSGQSSSLGAKGWLSMGTSSSLSIVAPVGTPVLPRMVPKTIVCRGPIKIESTPIQFAGQIIVDTNCSITVEGFLYTEDFSPLKETIVPVVIGDIPLKFLNITNGARVEISKGSSSEPIVQTLYINSGTLFTVNNLIVSSSFIWHASSSTYKSTVDGNGNLTISTGATFSITSSSTLSEHTLNTQIIILNSNSEIVSASNIRFLSSGLMNITSKAQLTIKNLVNIYSGSFENYGKIYSAFGSSNVVDLGVLTCRYQGFIYAVDGSFTFSTLKTYVLEDKFYYPQCCSVTGIYPTNFPGLLVDGFTTDLDTTAGFKLDQISIRNGGTLKLTGGDVVSVNVLEIDSANILGDGVLVVKQKFSWTHNSNPNTSTEISVGKGRITLESNCTSTINGHRYGTGKKFLNSKIVNQGLLTLYANNTVDIIGSGEVYTEKLATVKVEIAPPLVTTNLSACNHLCTKVVKKRSIQIVPQTWNCLSIFYDDGLACDCECGDFDPDCADTTLPIYGCKQREFCNSNGRCEAVTINNGASWTISGSLISGPGDNLVIDRIIIEDSGIINTTNRRLTITNIYGRSIDGSLFYYGNEISILGNMNNSNADDYTLVGGLTLNSDYYIKSFHWLPTDSKITGSGKMILQQTAELGGSRKFLDSSIILIGSASITEKLDFSPLSSFTVSKGATLTINSTLPIDNGKWSNYGFINVVSNTSDLMIGVLTSWLDVDDPSAGRIQTNVVELHFNTLNLMISGVPVLYSTTIGDVGLYGTLTVDRIPTLSFVSGVHNISTVYPIKIDRLNLGNNSILDVSGATTLSIVSITLDTSSLVGSSRVFVNSSLTWSSTASVSNGFFGTGAIVLNGGCSSMIGGNNKYLFLAKELINYGNITFFNTSFALQDGGKVTNINNIVLTMGIIAIESKVSTVSITNLGNFIVDNTVSSRNVRIEAPFNNSHSGSVQTPVNSSNVAILFKGLTICNQVGEPIYVGSVDGTQVMFGSLYLGKVDNLNIVGGSSVVSLPFTVTNLALNNQTTLNLNSDLNVDYIVIRSVVVAGTGSLMINVNGSWVHSTNQNEISIIGDSGQLVMAPKSSFYIYSEGNSPAPLFQFNRDLLCQGTLIITTQPVWNGKIAVGTSDCRISVSGFPNLPLDISLQVPIALSSNQSLTELNISYCSYVTISGGSDVRVDNINMKSGYLNIDPSTSVVVGSQFQWLGADFIIKNVSKVTGLGVLVIDTTGKLIMNSSESLTDRQIDCDFEIKGDMIVGKVNSFAFTSNGYVRVSSTGRVILKDKLTIVKQGRWFNNGSIVSDFVQSNGVLYIGELTSTYTSTIETNNGNISCTKLVLLNENGQPLFAGSDSTQVITGKVINSSPASLELRDSGSPNIITSGNTFVANTIYMLNMTNLQIDGSAEFNNLYLYSSQTTGSGNLVILGESKVYSSPKSNPYVGSSGRLYINSSKVEFSDSYVPNTTYQVDREIYCNGSLIVKSIPVVFAQNIIVEENCSIRFEGFDFSSIGSSYAVYNIVLSQDFPLKELIVNSAFVTLSGGKIEKLTVYSGIVTLTADVEVNNLILNSTNTIKIKGSSSSLILKGESSISGTRPITIDGVNIINYNHLYINVEYSSVNNSKITNEMGSTITFAQSVTIDCDLTNKGTIEIQSGEALRLRSLSNYFNNTDGSVIGTLNVKNINLFAESVPVITSNTESHTITISGDWTTNNWQSLTINGGSVSLQQNCTLYSLQLQNSTSFVSSSSLNVDNLSILSSRLMTDSVISVKTSFRWRNDNDLNPSEFGGSGKLLLPVGCTSIIGGNKKSIRLNLNVESYDLLEFSDVQLSLGATLAVQSSSTLMLNGDYIRFDSISDSSRIVNMGNILLNDTSSDVNLGRLTNYFNSSIDASIGTILFRGLRLLSDQNIPFFDGDSTGVQIISGRCIGSSIDHLELTGGILSSLVSVVEGLNFQKLVIRDSAHFEMSGNTNANITVENFEFYAGRISGDGHFVIATDGKWEKPFNSSYVSSFEGTGNVYVLSGATLIVENYGTKAQDFSSSRTVICEGKLAFGSRWFATSTDTNPWNINLTQGLLDVYSLSNGDEFHGKVYAINSVINGPHGFVRIDWESLILIQSSIDVGAETQISFKKLVIGDEVGVFFSSITPSSVTLLGPTSSSSKQINGLILSSGNSQLIRKPLNKKRNIEQSLTTQFNFDKLEIRSGSLLETSNEFDILIRELIISSGKLRTDSIINISSYFSWTTLNIPSSIYGSGVINLLGTANMEISGVSSSSLSWNDVMLNNSGIITAFNTINFPSFLGSLVNYGTITVSNSGDFLLQKVDNYNQLLFSSLAYELSFNSLYNKGSLNNTGLGRLIVDNLVLPSQGTIDTIAPVEVLNSSVLAGTITAPLFLANGHTIFNNTWVSKSYVKLSGVVQVPSDVKYAPSKACIEFLESTIEVDLKTSVLSANYDTLPIGEDGICNHGSVTKTSVSSKDRAVYDLCEIPKASSAFLNDYLVISISTEYKCPVISYDCQDPNALFNSCNCNTGYTREGGDTGPCVDIDECLQSSKICSRFSDCFNTAGSFYCVCRTGFNGNGTICTDIDECADPEKNPCAQSNAACVNTPGGYECTGCQPGYFFNGTTCADIDECNSSQPVCSSPRSCVNVPGSYYCTSCPIGYFDDTPSTCRDINECTSNPSLNGCVDKCYNTIGAYRCGNCTTERYEIHPLSTQCDDIDECEMKIHQCVNLRSCVNTNGSYFCSDCPSGYINDGDTKCIDVNECLDSNGGCIMRNCINTPGSYYCGKCPDNYYYNGYYTCEKRAVVPVFHCVGYENSSQIAYFGYNSYFNELVEFSVGSSNRFNSTNANRGQVSVFLPGLQSYQFAVYVNEIIDKNLTWYLDGSQVAIDWTKSCYSPPESPQILRSEYSTKVISYEKIEIGVSVISTYLTETLNYNSHCIGNEIVKYKKCNYDDALCIDSTTLEVGRSDIYFGNVENPNTCQDITILSTTTTRDLAIGTIRFKAGNYSKTEKINNDPAYVSDMLLVCCDEIHQNNMIPWDGSFELDIELPDTITVDIRLTNSSSISYKDWYYVFPPLLSFSNSNSRKCLPFSDTSILPKDSCQYINLPPTATPVHDYQRLIASRGSPIPLVLEQNKLVSAIVLWWSSIGEVTNVILDETEFVDGVNISYPLVNQQTLDLLQTDFPILPEFTLCDFDSFKLMKQGFEDAIEKLSAGQSIDLLQKQALSFALSDAWQNCADFAKSLLDVFQLTGDSTDIHCIYEPNSLNWTKDPCCNPNLDQCCLRTTVELKAVESKVRNACKLDTCALGIANSYAKSQQAASDAKQGCEAATRELLNGPSFQSTVFENCYRRTYGQRCSPFPEPTTDFDKRTLKYDNSVSCNQVDPNSICLPSGMCTIPCNKSEDCNSGNCTNYGNYSSCNIALKADPLGQKQLVTCLRNGINQYLLLYMTETINQKDTRTSVEFETKFYDAVIQESCEGPPLQTIVTTEKQCSNEKFCNWAQCQIDKTNCMSEYCKGFQHLGSDHYCAHCHESSTGRVCTEVSTFSGCVITDKDFNQYSGVCTIAGYAWNGLALYPCKNLNAKSTDCNPVNYCRSQKSCPGKCLYLQYNTASKCRSAKSINGNFLTWDSWTISGVEYGVCILNANDYATCQENFGLWRPGTEWIEASLNTEAICNSNGICTNRSLTTQISCEASGFCDLNAADTKAKCENSGVCNNPRGCILPFSLDGRCYQSSWTPMGCLNQKLSQIECFQKNGTYYNEITDKATCLGIKLCRDRRSLDAVTIDNQLLGLSSIPSGWNNKSMDKCIECNDSWESVYSWRTGKWFPNAWQNFTWQPRLVSKYSWVNTFSNEAFESLLNDARENYAAAITSTELVCKYGEEKDLLYRLSCDCTGGNHDCASIFDTTERTTTGVYKLCNGINSTNLFQGGSLKTENVVVDSKQTQCVLIKTSVVPFYQFKEKKILSLGGLIISDPQIHRNELKYIKNANGIVVGKVLGDGIGFEQDTKSNIAISGISTPATLRGVTICVEFPESTSDDVLNFEYLDLAYPNNTQFSEFAFLNLGLSTNTTAGSSVCINYTGNNIILFPVGSVKSYESLSYYDTWSSAELGLMYFGLVSYSTIFIWTLFNLGGHLLKLKEKRALRLRDAIALPHLILQLLAVFLLLRILFFILVPYGYVESNPAVETIFNELPALIFLSAYTFIVVKWAEIYHYTGNLKIGASLLRVSIGIVALLWISFIILLTLFTVLPNRQEALSCTSSDLDDGAVSLPIQTILALIYNLFFTIVCLITAGAFLFYGYKLADVLEEGQSSTTNAVKNKQVKKLQRLLAVSVLVTVILVANAIMLIVSSLYVGDVTKFHLTTLQRLIYIIIVELISCCIVSFMFAADSVVYTVKESIKTRASFVRNASSRTLNTKSVDSINSNNSGDSGNNLIRMSTKKNLVPPKLKIKAKAMEISESEEIEISDDMVPLQVLAETEPARAVTDLSLNTVELDDDDEGSNYEDSSEYHLLNN
eukprot:TRINITY_DN2112_c0_g1_i1.p1 TRINITY_DN2112_c0_g1~~TRINITY_DN2112_c0_g1_i1.p1  ORF type:complete len:5362 (-),score=1028.24 TRINITY_DN2112_c0_g1_i1:87-16172(-)